MDIKRAKELIKELTVLINSNLKSRKIKKIIY